MSWGSMDTNGLWWVGDQLVFFGNGVHPESIAAEIFLKNYRAPSAPKQNCGGACCQRQFSAEKVAVRCPGCGAILNSCNAGEICNPCNEALHDFSKKINPRLADYLRKHSPDIYFKITSERARTLTERMH